MPNILRSLPRLGRDQAGATAIEYCILVAAIAIVVVVGYSVIGQFPTNALDAVGSYIG